MMKSIIEQNKLIFKFMKWDEFEMHKCIDQLRAIFMNQDYEFTEPEFVIIDDPDPSIGILELILTEVDSNKFSKKMASTLLENYLTTNTKIFTKLDNESI